MTTFDTVVLVLLACSIFYSIFRGLVKEIFSLLAYVTGFYTANLYQRDLAGYIVKVLTNQTGARVVSFILIFLGTVILVTFIGKAVSGMLSSAGGLSLFNRVMGGIIGLAKGVAIVVAVMAPLELFPSMYNSITEDSTTAPYLKNISKLMRLGVADSANKIMDKVPGIPGMPDMADMGGKLKGLPELGKIDENIKQKVKELSAVTGKPQDSYGKDEVKQLEKILKSIEKE